MANNTRKSPKAKVFGNVAKKAKASPKAAKVTTVTKKNSDAKKQAHPEERKPSRRKIFFEGAQWSSYHLETHRRALSFRAKSKGKSFSR